MKYLYLLIDFFTVIVPFLFSFHPKINFHKKHKAFFMANAIIACIFITWDIIFTYHKIWGFNPRYLLGIYFYNLPIEEVLFFLCIPYSCVFTFHCLNLFFKLKWDSRSERFFAMGVSILLLCTGLYFYDRLYTSITLISTALLLLFLVFKLRINWFGNLISIYPVLLIPFFIVNGILTGTGLQEPVVWYNNNENVGFRLLTIPVEDIFYGFELILLNLFLMELLYKKEDVKEA